MKNLSKAHIILDCCYRLRKCICSDNIENTEYIEREVSQIKKYCSLLPKDISQKFTDYILKNINPLLKDDYWITHFDSSCGHLDKEQNCWVANNDQEVYNLVTKYFEVIEHQENKLKIFEQELQIFIN